MLDDLLAIWEAELFYMPKATVFKMGSGDLTDIALVSVIFFTLWNPQPIIFIYIYIHIKSNLLSTYKITSKTKCHIKSNWI